MHINGSVVTVTLGGGQTGAGLGDIVRNLFLHYGDAPADAVDRARRRGRRRPEARPIRPTLPPPRTPRTPAAAEPVVAGPTRAADG